MKHKIDTNIIKGYRMQKELIQIPRATLEVYKSIQDGVTIYEFDATECSPPEPMVNTIVVLQKIKSQNERLIVTFFHEPTPLYERVQADFAYSAQELEDGNFRVTFTKKI